MTTLEVAQVLAVAENDDDDDTHNPEKVAAAFKEENGDHNDEDVKPTKQRDRDQNLLFRVHTAELASNGPNITPLPSMTETVEQLLDRIVRSFSTALNNRQFDINLPPWSSHLSSNFTGIPSKSDLPAKRSGTLNKAEYIAHLHHLVKCHPEYRIDVESVDCHKDPGQGLAQVFLNYAVRGVPPGLTRQSVAIFKLKRQTGRVPNWKCVHVESADGMAGAEGAAGF